VSRISIRAGQRAVRKALHTFANISAVALLTLTVSTGYAATAPLRPETENQADRFTTEQVCDALAADATDYFGHVDVSVRDGVVTLSGYVWEPQELYRARELTARVPGVARVVNQMELFEEDK
jgi:osmotically-inducible protein OsmY